MRRLVGLTLVLALALPPTALARPIAGDPSQATAAVHAASVVTPSITFASWDGAYQLGWTVPFDYQTGYRFEARLDGAAIQDFEWTGTPVESSGVYDCVWEGVYSDTAPIGSHTLEVRAVSLDTVEAGPWAARTFSVLPRLPISIELSGPSPVAYDTTCTVTVTAPAGKSVTVRWVNPRDESAEATPVTFATGSCTYSFKARFSGVVIATFEGDGDYMMTLGELGVGVHAIMSRAHAPSTAKKGRTFSVWSTVLPKQADNRWVEFLCYRREKQPNGTYRYILRKTVKPKVKSYSATTTKMYQTFSLPRTGKWKIVPGYYGPACFPLYSEGAPAYVSVR